MMLQREGQRGVVAVILHRSPGCTGAIGQWLAARGYLLDIYRPRFGDRLPADPGVYAGTIIFGGPDSANDEHAFIRAELDWIALALDRNVPYLGICLGGQLLARLLGSRVDRHCDGTVERGYYPIVPTSAGLRNFGVWPSHVYQWHQEGFDLPRSAQLLAGSEGPFPNQAFGYGTSAIGLQFHPEITYMLVNRWSRREKQLRAPGALGRANHFSDHLVYAPVVRDWLDRLLSGWLDGNEPK